MLQRRSMASVPGITKGKLSLHVKNANLRKIVLPVVREEKEQKGSGTELCLVTLRMRNLVKLGH
jgi:hypothetical protein